MNGIISSKNMDINFLKEKLSNSPSMSGLDLVKSVTCNNRYTYMNNDQKTFKVAAISPALSLNNKPAPTTDPVS